MIIIQIVFQIDSSGFSKWKARVAIWHVQIWVNYYKFHEHSDSNVECVLSENSSIQNGNSAFEDLHVVHCANYFFDTKQ